MYYSSQNSTNSTKPPLAEWIYAISLFLLFALFACVGCTEKPSSVSLSSFEFQPDEKNLYLSDSRRFIAHAGGAIEGQTYTNTKEALERANGNGFRLIELDFSQTADGILVAVHDWGHWKSITGASNSPPVSFP